MKRRNPSSSKGNANTFFNSSAVADYKNDVVDECLAELDAAFGSLPVSREEPSTLNKDTATKRSQDTRNNHPLPNLQIELSRHLYVSKLSSFLLESCPLRIASFERWLMDSKLEETQKKVHSSEPAPARPKVICKRTLRRRLGSNRHRPRTFDAVIPSSPHSSDMASQRLVQEIIASLPADQKPKQLRAKATLICGELCAKAMHYAHALEQQAAMLAHSSHKPCHITLETGADTNSSATHATTGITQQQHSSSRNSMYSLVLEQKHHKSFVLRINASHYHKLHDMYANNTHTTHINQLHHFHTILFALILRYSSLSGGQQCKLHDARGGGMQGAIHEAVFDFLKETLDCRMECFASPFNVYLPRYCSAFSDLDTDFGSLGNFFDIAVGYLPEGCYQANPPFAPGIMTSMAHTIQRHLLDADLNDRTLAFVVVVPTCRNDDSSKKSIVEQAADESFQLLVQSKQLRLHIILSSREHGYIEASQHIRTTRYKESQYDTSVFLLQSAKSLENTQGDAWKKEFETGIRKAFASKHTEELLERRDVSSSLSPGTNVNAPLDCDTNADGNKKRPSLGRKKQRRR